MIPFSFSSFWVLFPPVGHGWKGTRVGFAYIVALTCGILLPLTLASQRPLKTVFREGTGEVWNHPWGIFTNIYTAETSSTYQHSAPSFPPPPQAGFQDIHLLLEFSKYIVLWIFKEAGKKDWEREDQRVAVRVCMCGGGRRFTLPWCTQFVAHLPEFWRQLLRGHTLIKTFLTWYIIYKSNWVRILILFCGYWAPLGSLIHSWWLSGLSVGKLVFWGLHPHAHL